MPIYFGVKFSYKMRGGGKQHKRGETQFADATGVVLKSSPGGHFRSHFRSAGSSQPDQASGKTIAKQLQPTDHPNGNESAKI